MEKNKLMLALAGFMIAAVVAIPAQADPPEPAPDCPGGFEEVFVPKATNKQDARNADVNKDKYVCEGPNLQYVDNTKKDR
jgi:hypothetical protein